MTGADGAGRPLIHEQLCYEIMAAAFEVHNVLGPGFVEGVYEESLAQELACRGLSVEQQRVIDVIYKGRRVGVHRLDMVVEGKVILELKATTGLVDEYLAQVLSYLAASGLELGLLINFGQAKVRWRRVVRTKGIAGAP